MPAPTRRGTLEKLTKIKLLKLARANGIHLLPSYTKTGMISRIMGELTAAQIQREAQKYM